MQTAAIRSSWIARAPHRRMDARFWLAVVATMAELNIDPATISDADVDRAITHLKTTVDAAKAEARAKRDQANALIVEARALEQQKFVDLF